MTTSFYDGLQANLQRSNFTIAFGDLIDGNTNFVRLIVYPASAERNTYRHTEIIAVSCRPKSVQCESNIGVIHSEGHSSIAFVCGSHSSVEKYTQARRKLRQYRSDLSAAVERWITHRAEMKSMMGHHNVHSFGRVARVAGTTTVAPLWSNDRNSVFRLIICNDLLIFIELTGRYISAIQKKLAGAFATPRGTIVDPTSAGTTLNLNSEWIDSSLRMVAGYLNLQREVSVSFNVHTSTYNFAFVFRSSWPSVNGLM